MANMSVQNELARLRQALNPGGAAAAAQPALPAAGPVANFANPKLIVLPLLSKTSFLKKRIWGATRSPPVFMGRPSLRPPKFKCAG